MCHVAADSKTSFKKAKGLALLEKSQDLVVKIDLASWLRPSLLTHVASPNSYNNKGQVILYVSHLDMVGVGGSNPLAPTN